MTNLLGGLELPRPAAAPDEGPLDARLYDLVETRVRRLLTDNPIAATYFGVHSEDSRLGDATRDAVLQEIADEQAHLAAIEALDPAGLSTEARFERDLEIHNVRLALFDADEVRRWERRASAAGDLGDAVFLLFARGSAPLAERLERITDRLEAAPAYLEASRTPGRRAAGHDLADRGTAAGEGPARAVRGGAGSRRGRPRRPRGSSGSSAPSRAPTPPSKTTTRGCPTPSPRAWTTGRWATSCTTSWSAGAGSATSTPTPSWPSAGTSCAATSTPAARPPASSSPTPTSPASSSGSRPTTRPRSRRPSRATRTRCAGRGRTSSSTTWSPFRTTSRSTSSPRRNTCAA